MNDQPLDILVVCTANRCRSPIGEVLLADALERHEVNAVVASAGLLGGDHPAEPEAVEAVAQIGLDLSQHRSRQVYAELVATADLILCMERMHVREISVDYRALRKTFTFKDFAERSLFHAPRNGIDMRSWIDQLAAGRDRGDVLGTWSGDEVADPMGKPLSAFVKTRDELKGLAEEVGKVLRRTQQQAG